MYFNRKTFFDSYRPKFGKLSPLQVKGLSQLLDFMEADKFITKIPYAAYILATVKRETASTYHPIHEYGGKAYFVKRYGGQTRKGKELGNDTPEEGYYYAGKGYPQTTGEANYEKAEAALRREYPEIVKDFEKRTGKKFDLTVGDQPNDESDPANMMDPAIAYATMSYGMRKGMFTGHKFSDHLDEIPPDYKQARRIINGTDHWIEIANDAKKFEKILQDSVAVPQDSAITVAHSTTGGVPSDTPPPDFTEGERPTNPPPPPETDSGAAPGATTVDSQMSPQVLDRERPSLFTRVMTGIIMAIGTAIASVTSTCGGNEIANMAARQGAQRVIENAERSDLQTFGLVVAYIALGLGAAVLLFWIASKIWEKSSERANRLNMQKAHFAADKLGNTVEFKR
jgi:putative chitinase